MCARYEIAATAAEIAKELEFLIESDNGQQWLGRRILPRGTGPVVINNGTAIKISMMQFGLIPKWSDDGRPKFSTFNTRLDSVEKPTWKRPFVSQRCLVPISKFYEPIYIGKYAGHWACFDAGLSFAAGIWDSWVNKATGEEIGSFSIITHDPLPIVEEYGHDRSPLFLEKNGWAPWIENKDQDIKTLQTFAAAHRYLPKIKASKSDPMKPGWEKRIPK